MFKKQISIIFFSSIVLGISCHDSKQKMSIVPLNMLNVTDSLIVEGKKVVSRTEYYLVKEYIDKIEDTTIKNFFEVAFSQTIRDCSWTRKNEFKLYKMDSEKIKTFKPEVFTNFEKTLCNNRKGLLDLIQSKKNDAFSHIYDFNTVKYIPSDLIHEKSVDLVVTSPPYGDSQTTVAYGQFSRLANQWLGYENSQKLDASLMGGTRPSQIEKFENKTLNKQINQIKSIDEKRIGAFVNS